MRPRRPALVAAVAAVAGVLAVVAALAVAHLFAGLVDPESSPYLAVGNAAIDRTPEWAKSFAIEQFGSNDKKALLVGMGIVLLLVGAVAGLLTRVRVAAGVAVLVALGVVGALAVLDRPDTARVGVLSALVAAVVAVSVLLTLLRAAAAPAVREDGAEVSRRSFLGTSAAVAVGAGVAGLGGQAVLSKVDASVVGTRAAAQPLPPLPAGVDFVADGGLPFTTSNDTFYRVDTALSPPQVSARDWSLRIHGMVDREITLSFDELVSRPLEERRVTLTCVSNEVGGDLVGSAAWVGVSLRDLLLEAGVQAGADQLLSTAIGGYSAGTPLATVLEPDRGAMLAVNMNGQPLPVEHGFPVRMLVPGVYGYASATKWITDIELTTFAQKKAYWVPRGYAERAPIKLQSQITSPGGFEQVPAGRVTVTGTAWRQGVGIRSVEVRLDDGPWLPARLGTEVGRDTWRMWRIDLPDVGAGSHTVTCRATDAEGNLQVQERAATLPDGASGWHSALFTVA